MALPIAACLSTVPTAYAAEPDATTEVTTEATGLPSPDQWLLFGGPEIAVYAFSAKGGSTSTNITGPRVNPPNSGYGDLGIQISAPERSRELVASFIVGGTIGALSPALDLPGRPRAFTEINVSYPRTAETSFARRGNPGKLEFPIGGRPPSPVGEGAMNGGGTQMSAQHQEPQVHAGLGVALDFPVPGDQLVRLKLGAQYSRTVVDVEGQTIRPVRLNDDAGDDQQLDDFRVIALQDNQRKVYHASGPSVEFEYFPNIRWGPFLVSAYGRGHAAYSFTSPKTQLQQCNTANGQPNECASWKYVQDRWSYRATIGFRLSWAPHRIW